MGNFRVVEFYASSTKLMPGPECVGRCLHLVVKLSRRGRGPQEKKYSCGRTARRCPRCNGQWFLATTMKGKKT